eukprot:TRINITY_DN35478_c0_g1_i1.p3 TRINITY_DN35478_c0_g1~~TRINITY_DN35478_c0_g1_i1.p3  ORF type:complete len:219 (-),score=53.01 TRINITY_DN35478_c0_g1_i1:38-694(-)
MSKKVGVLGSGDVGKALALGFKKHGYDVMIAARDAAKVADFASKEGIRAGTFDDAAGFAQLIVLAVVGEHAENALRLAGAERLEGKVILDATNPIALSDPPENGVLKLFTKQNTSLMEQLQSAFPKALFVKAFNTIGHALMVNPALEGGLKPTMFYCGNDAAAKAEAKEVIEKFGWVPCDSGLVESARALEPLVLLWCALGFRNNDWAKAFHLLRPGK